MKALRSIMRLIGPSVFVLIAFLLCTSVALAGVPSTDKNEIRDQIELIVDSVNRGDADAILGIMSPNARPALGSEIEESIAGKSIHFEQGISSYDDLGDGRVRVTGRYSAEGPGWSVSGLSNSYVFEKHDDSWLLVDTDFHQKLGPGHVFRMVGRVFAIIIPVFLLLGAFWLWMLIDAARRQFDNKTLWIILIIFLSFLGAILYFFLVRRGLKQQEKLGVQSP